MRNPIFGILVGTICIVLVSVGACHLAIASGTYFNSYRSDELIMLVFGWTLVIAFAFLCLAGVCFVIALVYVEISEMRDRHTTYRIGLFTSEEDE